MAKRKTPKIKDLRPSKISNEQLDELQKLIADTNRLQINVGGLESQKYDMLRFLSDMNAQIMRLQKKFEKEYGTSDINIQDGTINYKSKENGEVNKKN